MSNTLNTPIEALERDYPLRIERYALRRGSGGAGAMPGGEGVVRTYRVLADCRLGLMTERRRHGPPGAAGGEDGARGRNLLNGRQLPAKASLDLRAGDVLEIRTPGGGGWGRPARQ
jgi:N-methylhydantoinase B